MVLGSQNVSLRGRCKVLDSRRTTSETFFNFREKFRRKRSFWKSGSSIFANTEFARFGNPDLQLSVSQKTLFWKSGSSIFATVSQNLLVLEVRIFSFRSPRKRRFGTSRGICSFWESGSAVTASIM